ATRTLVSRSDVRPTTFPISGVERVELSLGKPNASLDGDRDGFVDQLKGGSDCDDAQASIFPGATQPCDATVDLNCDGKVGCAEAACASTPTCQRPVTRVVFVASPQAGVAAFECSSALTVESGDATGATAVGRDTVVAFVGSLPGTEFFSDAQCTQSTTSGTIAAGGTRTTVYMRASSTGTQMVSATSTGIGGASATFPVTPQPVRAFSLETTSSQRTAGECFSVTLKTVDAAGRPTRPAQALTATLAANPTTGTAFYEDGNTTCTGSAITAVTLLQSDTMLLRVRTTRATSAGMPLTLSASAASVTEGTLQLTVAPSTPHQVYFASPAPGLVVNTCSGPTSLMTVGVEDVYGNPTTVATATAVTLTATRVGAGINSLTFYTDTACTTGLSGMPVTIPAGQGLASSVAHRATDSGTYTVTASAPGLLTGSQQAVIANGPPSRIVLLTAPPVTLRAGECSTSPVRVETRDSSDSRSAVSGVPLVVEVSAPGLSFFGDASCSTPLPQSPNTSLTIPVGFAEGSFYLRGTQTTSTVVTVVAAAYPAGNNSRTLPVTVTSGTPFALKWVGTSSQTLTATSCSAAYTLEVQDSQGNPTRFTSATALSFGPSVVSISTSPACAAGAATFPSTSSQLTLYAQSSTAGTHALTASTTAAPFITSSAPGAQLIVTPGTATQLATLAPAMPSSVVAGQCVAVTVERRDAQNNAVPVSGATSFTLNATPSTGLTSYASQSDCQGTTNPLTSNAQSITAGAGATFWVRATRTPNTSLSVTAGSLTSTAFTLTVTPAAAGQLVWTVPASLPAGINAGACISATLQRRDAFGNPATDSSALAVSLSNAAPSSMGAVGTTGSSAGTAAFAASSCGAATPTLSLSIPSGQSSVNFLVTSGTAGSMTVTPGSELAANASATFNVVAGAATQLVFTATPGASMVAGACAALTAERRDASNNPVSFTGSFTLSAPAGVTAYANASDCSTTTSPTTTLSFTGSSATFYVRPTVATSTALTVSDSTSLSAMTTVSVTPDVASVLLWSSGAPSGFAVDACQVLTLERRDRFGNFSTSNGATLSVDVGASGAASATVGLSTASNCSSASGMATVSFSSAETSKAFSVRTTTSGSLSLTPTSTPALSGSGTANGVARTFTITPGAFAALTFLASPASTVAGTCVPNTAQLRDAFGNVTTAASDVIVNLSATTGAAGFATSCTGGSPAGSVTVTTGNSSIGFGFTPTTAPTTVIHAQASAVNANQSWPIVPAALAKLALTGDAGVLTAGACSSTLTVQAQDTFDNAVTLDAGMPLTLTPAAEPGLTFHSAAACTGGAAVSIANGNTQTSFSFRPTAAPSSFNVTSSNGSVLTSNALAFTINVGAPSKLGWKAAVTPPASMARFACAGPFTVQTQDAQSNPSPVSATATLNLSATPSTAVQFFTGATCSGSPVSAVTISGGSSEATFYAVAFGPGASTTLTVADAATVLTSVTTTPTLTGSGTPALAVTSGASVVEAGGCQAITVTRRDGSAAAVTLGSTVVSLSSNDSALTVHTDAACTATGTLTIASGSSTATGYVAGHSANSASVTISASDGASIYATGTLNLTALPLVRRGTFTFSDTGSTTFATLSPEIPGHDISRTALVFQATVSDDEPSDANVECHLNTASGTSVRVNCTRSGTDGTVTVNWQTASWGRSAANGGVSVQHRGGSVNTGTTIIDTLPASAALGQSFVLFSSASSGMSNSVDDFATATLTGATTLTITTSAASFATGGYTWSADVVTFAGASVQRPSTVLGGSGTTYTRQLATAVTLSRSVPLYSARPSTTGDSGDICKKRLRGELVANMANVDFVATRGVTATTGGCTDSDVDSIAFEAVEFPVGTVVQNATDASFNAASRTTTISTVVQHRTLLLMGGQGPGGAAAGEADATSSGNLGVFNARLGFNSDTQISVTRAANTGNARFSPYVIQFAP
ncbi:MAG: hypothetical protein JNG84_04645, partial [Archangium sp.]|nr:hypothetical protein [Archangium sp.]